MERLRSNSVLCLFTFWLLLLASFCSAESQFRRPPGRDRSKLHKLPQLSNAQRFSSHKKRAANGSECHDTKPGIIKAPKKNVWRQLSGNESDAITHWLHRQKDLDLNRGASYASHGNDFVSVELQIPNKTDVLAYLDGDGSEPARYARALVIFNSKDESTYNYILAGPMPVTSKTTWQTLTYPFTRKTGSIRNLDWYYEKATNFLDKAARSVRNITQNLWPGVKSTVYYGTYCVIWLAQTA